MPLQVFQRCDPQVGASVWDLGSIPQLRHIDARLDTHLANCEQPGHVLARSTAHLGGEVVVRSLLADAREMDAYQSPRAQAAHRLLKTGLLGPRLGQRHGGRQRKGDGETNRGGDERNPSRSQLAHRKTRDSQRR